MKQSLTGKHGIRHRKFWKNEKNWQKKESEKLIGSITSSMEKYSVGNVGLLFCDAPSKLPAVQRGRVLIRLGTVEIGKRGKMKIDATFDLLGRKS